MIMTMTSTVTAPRPRTLAPTDQWAVVSLDANHNSIAALCPTVITTDFVPAPAGGVGYGAAKQAAPPRGVPR